MSLKDMNTTERFSDRVADYVRYRPSYPQALLDYLNQKMPLQGLKVADIGAGTGIFTKLLLDRGAFVDAVEPNAGMAAAAEKLLGETFGFRLFSGTAENTGLESGSIDLITCAQAFHWFDIEKSRAEFDRILKPGGLVALIWNDPRKDDGLGQAYEDIQIEFGGEEYKKVSGDSDDIEKFFPKFFGAGKYEVKVFENSQELDEAGLIGRFFSSSFIPQPDTDAGVESKKKIVNIFNQFQINRKICLRYKTELFLGN